MLQNNNYNWGFAKLVRHRILIPAFGGSSPSSPAIAPITQWTRVLCYELANYCLQSINNVMDYKKHYDLLIERARKRTLHGYTERHHVVPKCLGGTNDSANLVDLTPEEHYFAHQLLVKLYDNPSLVNAALMMTVESSTQNEGLGRGNKLYGWLKRRYQLIAKQRLGTKNGSFGKPWYYDPSTLLASKFIPGSEPEGWSKGRVPKKVNKCLSCSTPTQTKLQNWCDACRPKPKKTVFKETKTKSEFSDSEKIEALKKYNGNIRRALFSLGLNDSGVHYKKMKELKASLYPLATNQLKG